RVALEEGGGLRLRRIVDAAGRDDVHADTLRSVVRCEVTREIEHAALVEKIIGRDGHARALVEKVVRPDAAHLRRDVDDAPAAFAVAASSASTSGWREATTSVAPASASAATSARPSRPEPPNWSTTFPASENGLASAIDGAPRRARRRGGDRFRQRVDLFSN